MKTKKIQSLEEGLERLVQIGNSYRPKRGAKKAVTVSLPPELESEMWNFIEEADSDMRALFVENEERITPKKMREAIRDFLGDRFWSEKWTDETSKEFDKLVNKLALRAYPGGSR